MSQRNFLTLLLLAKVLFCFISWYIIGAMTQLGDTQDYLSGRFLYRENWASTAYIMSYFGKMFANLVGYNVFANFPLMLAGFWGCYIAVKNISLTNMQWFGLLICLCLPSTLMWTSIHSKEAVLNFLLGLFAYFLIKKLDGNSWDLRDKLILILTLLLIAFFKPLYVPAVSWFLFYTLSYGAKVKKVMVTAFTTIALLSLFAFFIITFESELTSYLQLFHRNFSVQGELTRVGNVWRTVDEFLLAALGGMVISFIGPTLGEAAKHITMLPFFFEGVFSFVILIFLIIQGSRHRKGIYVHTFFMLSGGFILFLLAQYPVGYFNPGSALRYKQSFQPFLFIMLFYFAYSVRNKAKYAS